MAKAVADKMPAHSLISSMQLFSSLNVWHKSASAWCESSMIAFACGFLVAMNFVLALQDNLAMSLKSIPTNSFPPLRLILSGQGHLFSHVHSMMSATVIARLSSCLAISNHPVAGLTTVTAFKIKGLRSIFFGHFFPGWISCVGGLLIA